jgi:hypothetical protein
MNQQKINSFLRKMFDNRTEFAAINGAAKMMDADYMLMADVVSENIELLGEVIAEHFEENINSFELVKVKEQIVKCAYKR